MPRDGDGLLSPPLPEHFAPTREGFMKYRISALTFYFGIGAIFGACGQALMTGPTAAPMHDNIPATLEGDPGGQLYYLCATQLREYTTADGRHLLEEDHYLKTSPCPATLIK